MSFIDTAALKDVKEPEAVDEGTYSLTIVNAEEKEAKSSGAPMISVAIGIDDHPDAAAVYVNLVMPREGDDAKTVQFKNLNMKRFLELSGADYMDGFEVEDLFGLNFEGFLTKEEVEQEDPDAPPKFRNELKIPRLAS